VVDEVEVPAEVYAFHVVSAVRYPPPVIHELVKTWTHLLPHLILSGRLSTEVVERDMRGMVAKEGPRLPLMIEDIGAFNVPQEQQHYLEQYFPLEFLQTESSKGLMIRVNLWLCGRYVNMLSS
jgi:hypothetical protein